MNAATNFQILLFTVVNLIFSFIFNLHYHIVKHFNWMIFIRCDARCLYFSCVNAHKSLLSEVSFKYWVTAQRNKEDFNKFFIKDS